MVVGTIKRRSLYRCIPNPSSLRLRNSRPRQGRRSGNKGPQNTHCAAQHCGAHCTHPRACARTHSRHNRGCPLSLSSVSKPSRHEYQLTCSDSCRNLCICCHFAGGLHGPVGGVSLVEVWLVSQCWSFLFGARLGLGARLVIVSLACRYVSLNELSRIVDVWVDRAG